MLQLPIYNILLNRVQRGPLDAGIMEDMTWKDSPVTEFLRSKLRPYFVLNNLGSDMVPILTKGQALEIPEGMPLFYQMSQNMVDAAPKGMVAYPEGIIHHMLAKGVYEPWLVVTDNSGRVAELSLNVLARKQYYRSRSTL